jgi:hypothetical protein
MEVVPGEEIPYFAFEWCPICLNESAQLSREHVPPESLGGDVRTLTCLPCNNRLGSRVEDEFVAWWNDELCVVRFSNPQSEILGHRFAESVAIRYATDGSPVFVVKGGARDEIKAMLQAGNLVAEFRSPDSVRYRIAALKQAYLAACILMRSIPTTHQSEALRQQLIAARDAPDSGSVPSSEIAAALRLARASERAENLPTLATCAVKENGETIWMGVLLGGSIAVEWPPLGVHVTNGEHA